VLDGPGKHLFFEVTVLLSALGFRLSGWIVECLHVEVNPF
jgi:hypothetical protein